MKAYHYLLFSLILLGNISVPSVVALTNELAEDNIAKMTTTFSENATKSSNSEDSDGRSNQVIDDLPILTKLPIMSMERDRDEGRETISSTEEQEINDIKNDQAEQMPSTIEASYVKNTNGWEYSIVNGLAILNKYTGSGEVTVPSTIDNYKTKLLEISKEVFPNYKQITRFSLGSTIELEKETLNSAFEGWENLASVDLTGLNTSNVISMANLFKNCYNLQTVNLGKIDTSNVTDMELMFVSCNKLASIDVSSLNTSNVTNMKGMFSGCTSLQMLDLSMFDTMKVVTMSYMFSLCSQLKSVNLANFNTDSLQDISYMFNGCNSIQTLDLSNFNTENVTNMKGLFNSCTQLQTVDVSKFNTTNVTDMDSMFSYCQNLQSLDLRNFNTERVTNMAYMFSNCSNLQVLDISSFNTARVTNMNDLFRNCIRLQNIDLSKFDTANVIDIRYMFYGCMSLQSLDVSNFNTTKIKNMDYLFSYCTSLTKLDLSNFATDNVTTMKNMFSNCTRLQSIDVSSFNTENVQNMDSMFSNCPELRVIDLRQFNTQNSSTNSMFQTSSPTILFVLTRDTKLLNYDYAANNRLIGGPIFQANGGQFDNQEITKTYFDSCAIKPDDPKLEIATFAQFKQQLLPKQDGFFFSSWAVIEGTEPTNKQELFKTVKYTAQWTNSSLDINIPSDNIDNVKPGITGTYGIAYMPKEFTIPATNLLDEQIQEIPIYKNISYHVAVRDKRMIQGSWTLQAQLIWQGNVLPGSYLKTTNSVGIVKNNTNDGSNEFQESDLIGISGEVTGQRNVHIQTDAPNMIMKANNIAHNAVYDYNLGEISLVLANAKMIQPGVYSGKISWNLVDAP